MEEGVEVDVERDAESVLQVRPGLRRRAADRAHVKSTDNVYLLQRSLKQFARRQFLGSVWSKGKSCRSRGEGKRARQRKAARRHGGRGSGSGSIGGRDSGWVSSPLSDFGGAAEDKLGMPTIRGGSV